MVDKVSVIIPTYNRFKLLLNTIESIKKQTHTNIEIIVINDNSNEKEYYEYNWNNENIIIKHLEKNSKDVFGYGCAAYVKNFGIDIATGDYIAFCDDDDIWFPTKLELQLEAMKTTNCKMSSTEGLIGNGVYNSTNKYKKYNSEMHYDIIKNIYKHKGSNLFDKGFPKIWNYEFLKIHNCVINSSVIIEKSIIDKVGKIKCINSGEDYDYWLRILQHTDSVYIYDVCFYYDDKHGYGRNY